MAAVARAAARAAAARVAARAAVASAAAVMDAASEHAASVRLVQSALCSCLQLCRTLHRASSSSFTSNKGLDMPAEPAALAYRAREGIVGL